MHLPLTIFSTYSLNTSVMQPWWRPPLLQIDHHVLRVLSQWNTFHLPFKCAHGGFFLSYPRLCLHWLVSSSFSSASASHLSSLLLGLHLCLVCNASLRVYKPLVPGRPAEVEVGGGGGGGRKHYICIFNWTKSRIFDEMLYFFLQLSSSL